MLLATMVAGPDLQKVKNNVILARPGFICTCANTCFLQTEVLTEAVGVHGERAMFTASDACHVRVPSTVYEFFAGLGNRWGDFSQALFPHLTLNFNHVV